MSVGTHQPFQFSTKARNLAQLDGRLTSARTVEQEVVRVGDWRSAPEACIARVQKRFGDGRLIVRSSAHGEDSVESSMAGAFESILDVDGRDSRAIAVSVDEVVKSYGALRSGVLDDYEVLVQPMVAGVRASGVVFTRDLDKGGPYYLVNYDDETDRTDSVTGGGASNHKAVRIFKGVDAAQLEPVLRVVVLAARELESITASDALDIEFAIDDTGSIFVLQVRPLARTRILSFQRLDIRIADELRHAGEFVQQKFERRPHLFGRTTILGEMPDWNPAEIIGTQPKPLAYSLYAHIIMRSVWRQARHLIGYKHPAPHQLLVEVAGRPYVDVRCSFNSLLPASLRDELCEKLVNHYLDVLRAHPEFHDKIEFEIVISCLDFAFDKQAARLKQEGFSDGEVDEIRKSLVELTDALVSDRTGVLRKLEEDVRKLGARRGEVLGCRDRVSGIPALVDQLLEDCIEYGTLPFSVFARCAFIGNSFLKSLVHRGVLTEAEVGDYLHSIETVTGAFMRDLELCKSGGLALEQFLEQYGHLRPGTYDVCAFSYSERPELYLGVDRKHAGSNVRDEQPAGRSGIPGFPAHAMGPLKALLKEHGFTFDVDTLNQFIIRAIQLREAVKFEFTRNLSMALSLLVEFGKYHGLSRESISFLPVEEFIALSNRSFSEDWSSRARDLVDRNRKRYELTGAINLPDLIFSPTDIQVIKLQRRRPNFVTQKRIVARSVSLDSSMDMDQLEDLAGAIVLIENADPGFDWLFARNIGGLVTKHGGAASHMTIRCAELGLPAAIGCGEQIFEELGRTNSVLLDCAERRVEPNAV